MPAQIIRDRCIGCDICDRRCPLDVIRMVPLPEPTLVLGRKVDRVAEIVYPDECWHCGVCRLDCPTNAVAYLFPEDMVQGPESMHPVVSA